MESVCTLVVTCANDVADMNNDAMKKMIWFFIHWDFYPITINPVGSPNPSRTFTSVIAGGGASTSMLPPMFRNGGLTPSLIHTSINGIDPNFPLRVFVHGMFTAGTLRRQMG
jgi:hypothetical protein